MILTIVTAAVKVDLSMVGYIVGDVDCILIATAGAGTMQWLIGHDCRGMEAMAMLLEKQSMLGLWWL